MTKNVVYTTGYCPFCTAVKNLLERYNVKFEEKVLESRSEIEKVKKEFNWRTVPIVVLNGKFIGGFDDTQALIKEGKLDDFLAGNGD